MQMFKKTKAGLILIFSCILICATTARGQTHQDDAAIANLAFKNMDFAMNLYRKISSYHDNNIFFSPMSISTSFAALLMGSGGVTRQELLRGFNLEQLEQVDQPELIPKLFQLLHQNVTHNGTLNLDQAMALFVDRRFQVDKLFEDRIKDFFDTDIKTVDFTDTKVSAQLINEHIRQKTGNKVSKMISSLDPMMQLMLINTIFFMVLRQACVFNSITVPMIASTGEWETPFSPNRTQSLPFYVDNYNIVRVPMMFVEDRFYTMEDVILGAKALKLPYKAGISMLILLPNSDIDYTLIDEEISAAKFKYWTGKLQKVKVEVQMPKFTLDKSYPLHDILPDMGITSIFTFSANLTQLSRDVKVSEVLHKAVIEVDETGTTAAAATTTGIIAYSLPRTFIVNRPFFFFIYHEDTNTLLFMGRVIDPSKK